MANTLKCQDCKHYDVIRSGQTKMPQYGWCSIKSVYPFAASVGQVFPPGVRRAASAELPAKPEIVKGADVVTQCTKGAAK